jgi:DNA mismatch repair protein MutH
VTRPGLLPPRDEAELWQRAEALQGRSVLDLGQALGQTWCDPTRSKGQAGQWLEQTLGASAGSLAEPDFPHLGIELKTIPIGPNGQVRQSTWVTRVAMLDDQETWETSAVRRKLLRVLWIPLHGEGLDQRVGRPRRWRPDASELARLQADWHDLMELVVLGRTDEIDARLGECLQIRPKGAHAAVRVAGLDVGGHRARVLPLGFYLRPSFTARVLAGT